MAKSKLIRGRPTVSAGLYAGAGSISDMFPARFGRQRNLLDLVRQIRDYNADASKAISNVLRLANSSWDLDVFQLDGETPDPEGQQLVDALATRVGQEYGGGLDVLIDMIHLTAATQGAAAGEVELDAGLADVADLVIVNPWLIDFQRNPDTLRWRPGIRSLGAFEALNELQFRYIPIDPEPDDPRGRSPFWAALDIIFFQMEVLRDLKSAAHFAGYPRIDLSVAWEAVFKVVQETRPDLLNPGNAGELRAWLDLYLGDISDSFDDLNADDAFVHYDSIKSEYITPKGETINIKDLIGTIDAQIVSGLKQLPILLGRNEGATTTHATVQWQVFVQELRSYQRVSARLIEWAMNLALQVWGRQGIVKLTYEALRTSDRAQDATAASEEATTAAFKRDQGWITNDEAAQEVTGHDAVDDPQPAGNPPPPNNNNRSAVEDIAGLPLWQQQRYRELEAAAWTTYRDQIRRAYQRLEPIIQEDEKPAGGKHRKGGIPKLELAKNGNGHRKEQL